jgi:hypothetical protein
METMYLYIALLVTDQIRVITAGCVRCFAEPEDYVDFKTGRNLL